MSMPSPDSYYCHSHLGETFCHIYMFNINCRSLVMPPGTSQIHIPRRALHAQVRFTLSVEAYQTGKQARALKRWVKETVSRFIWGIEAKKRFDPNPESH